MDAREPLQLGTALGLATARVVAFTGGGGKTSAMFRLTSERAAGRVLLTTTTRIWVPRPEQAPVILATSLDDARGALDDPEWVSGVRALGTAVSPEGKLVGVPPDWIGELRWAVDLVVVEADGAAGKPLTAPRAYEPVIPADTDLLVPVVGADALGVPLSSEHVHRAPEMAALLGVAPGTVLTEALVARVLLSPQGNVKGAPPGARIVPLVNKVDDASRARPARALAAALLAAGAERVVLAHLAGPEAVVDVVVPALTRSV